MAFYLFVYILKQQESVCSSIVTVSDGPLLKVPRVMALMKDLNLISSIACSTSNKLFHETIQIQSVITICLSYSDRIVYALCCIFGDDFKTVFSNSNLFGWLMIDLLE